MVSPSTTLTTLASMLLGRNSLRNPSELLSKTSVLSDSDVVFSVVVALPHDNKNNVNNAENVISNRFPCMVMVYIPYRAGILWITHLAVRKTILHLKG